MKHPFAPCTQLGALLALILLAAGPQTGTAGPHEGAPPPRQCPDRAPSEADIGVPPPEPTGALTLSQALEQAVRYNPALAASAAGTRAAEENARQAATLPNPEFEIEASEFGGSGARQGYDAAETSIRLTQSLELGGKRDKRRRLAESESRRAGWDHEANRLEVLAQTRRAFVEVLLAQGQVALTESLLAVAEDMRKATAERVKSGKVPPLEETRADVEAATARVARDRALSEWEEARKRLAASWGGVKPLFTSAVGDLEAIPDAPPLEALARRLDETPEIARAREELASTRESLALARAERLPTVAVSAGLTRFEDDDTHAGTAGLSLPLPVFDRNAGGIRAATHQATRAAFDLQAARVRLRTELSEAHNRLAAARAEAATVRARLVPGAEQAFTAAQAGYREGKFGYLEVLDAQRTLSEVKGRYLDTLAACHRAAADVERLTGVPLKPIQ